MSETITKEQLIEVYDKMVPKDKQHRTVLLRTYEIGSFLFEIYAINGKCCVFKNGQPFEDEKGRKFETEIGAIISILTLFEVENEQA